MRYSASDISFLADLYSKSGCACASYFKQKDTLVSAIDVRLYSTDRSHLERAAEILGFRTKVPEDHSLPRQRRMHRIKLTRYHQIQILASLIWGKIDPEKQAKLHAAMKTYIEDRWNTPEKQRRRWAVLTKDDVRTIRASSEQSVVLAERYSVSISSINNVRSRRTWRWVE